MRVPEVSAIVAVRDGAPFLEACLQSLRGQQAVELEILLCDDGSVDATSAMLKAFASEVPAVRIVTNDAPQGLARSLNSLLELADSPLIARLDADDIADPNRMALQRQAFIADDDLVLLGSNVRYIDADGRPLGRSRLLERDSMIRAGGLFMNPFHHPAAMMRLSVLRRHQLAYDPSFETTQDWDLWARLMPHGRVANLPNCLVYQRLHAGSVSSRRRTLQRQNSIRVQHAIAHALFGASRWSDADFDLINGAFMSGRVEADAHGYDRIAACHLALDIYEALSDAAPDLASSAFRRWLLNRCLRVGLRGPPRPGWRSLSVRLLRDHATAVPRVVADAWRSHDNPADSR